ncbi:MAG: IclR family transcriptional regulator [Litoreibacter sp.]|nr:IclR family transcriptional regulator [Litoreibacter sp.]
MTETQRIPTNLRTLLILETLGHSTDPMTSAEIGRAVGLGKQTMHRLCNTLLEEGFLVNDESGRGFRPGRRCRSMASGILHASSAHVLRHQILRNLAQNIGETINFLVPEDRGMAYHDRVETNWAFRIQLPVGSHVPFHCTASGKTYLASLPRAERKRIVQVMQLDASTPGTITQPEKLLMELQKIAKQGYALDNEEFLEGMVAIAVPVLDSKGHYCASLAFHGPVQRISLEDALSKKGLMLEASRQLTETLFMN